MKYWLVVDELNDAFDCDECEAMVHRPYNYCPNCGDKKEFVELITKTLSIKEYRDEYERCVPWISDYESNVRDWK